MTVQGVLLDRRSGDGILPLVDRQGVQPLPRTVDECLSHGNVVDGSRCHGEGAFGAEPLDAASMIRVPLSHLSCGIVACRRYAARAPGSTRPTSISSTP